ncbi:hypothetical protein Q7F20_09290 [Curtobacterium sp. A7_M15]|uniref:hypothetical protein n=1 Tax=Curtobacterium sp. A7_M15 TaxID=3065241 RepID=UPI002737CF53|nr:hypothetical protein [Curtobacterium sp. A7_M15]MDP4333565.1 hypothetical protein [Curtobacterium sp. A7_M15]
MALHKITYDPRGVMFISTDLDTAQGQQDMDDILATELDHQASLNLQRRTQGKKTERFPRPATGWKTKTMDTYLHRVGLHLHAVALRMLNDNVEYVLDEAGKPLRGRLLSQEQLGDALYFYVHHKAAQHIVHDEFSDQSMVKADKTHRLINSRLVRKVDEVAAWALEVWDKDARARARRRGAAGGRESRRGPKYTLEAFLALPEGLTKKQQAEALGCKSTGTIDNLRRQAKAAVEAPAPEAVERPMEPLDVIPVDRPFWVSARTQSDARFFERHEAMLEQARAEVTAELTEYLDDILPLSAP